MCALIKTYGLRGMFGKGLPMLRLAFYQLQELIKEMLPELCAHFEREEVTPLLYASEWFSTLFVYTFPLPLVTKVWDVFFMEDILYLFKLSLAILKISQHEILQLEFEGIIRYLKSKGGNLDGVELIKIADSVEISKERMDKLETEWKLREKKEWAERMKKRGIYYVFDESDITKIETTTTLESDNNSDHDGSV